VKVLAFDLDDTLVRWKPAVAEAAVRAAAAAAGSIDPAVLVRAVRQTWEDLAVPLWTGRMDEEGITRATTSTLVAALGISPDEGAALYAAFVEHLSGLIVPYEDTAVLPALRERYRLGVATNGLGPVQRAKLRHAGLAPLFDFVVVSAEIGVAKPDPAFYEVVQRAADAPAREITVVGDNVTRDLLPARAVGMAAVWICRNNEGLEETSWDGPVVTSLYQLESMLV